MAKPPKCRPGHVIRPAARLRTSLPHRHRIETLASLYGARLRDLCLMFALSITLLARTARRCSRTRAWSPQAEMNRAAAIGAAYAGLRHQFVDGIVEDRGMGRTSPNCRGNVNVQRGGPSTITIKTDRSTSTSGLWPQHAPLPVLVVARLTSTGN